MTKKTQKLRLARGRRVPPEAARRPDSHLQDGSAPTNRGAEPSLKFDQPAIRGSRPLLAENALSSALYSLGHGSNDAQKTIGIIWILLISIGGAREDHIPLWVIVSCYLAMALGTLFGGWRIVKTMGQKITKLRPVGGFSAETGGAITLFAASSLGVPVSTTPLSRGGEATFCFDQWVLRSEARASAPRGRKKALDHSHLD
jgi:hypothetical protein